MHLGGFLSRALFGDFASLFWMMPIPSWNLIVFLFFLWTTFIHIIVLTLDDAHPFKESNRLSLLDDVHPFKESYRLSLFRTIVCIFLGKIVAHGLLNNTYEMLNNTL